MCLDEFPADDAGALPPTTVRDSALGVTDFNALLSRLKHVAASADGDQEMWKPVVGWENSHEVSNKGRVRRFRIIGAKERQYGYMKATLRIETENRHKSFFIHRLVLEAFKGPCPPGKEGCHENGVRHDNRIENLRWDTRKANFADRDRHGTTARGERGGNSKLTEEQVRTIRAMHGRHSAKELAEAFGVCTSTIFHIHNGDTWKHVT